MLTPSLVGAAPPRPLKALLVTGGCCHDYPAQKEILKKGLEQRAYIDVEVVYQGGTATDSKIELYSDPDWAQGFDVVLHDECFAAVNDNAWTQGILKPHRAGLPGVVLHCAMHCYRDGTTDWFEFCGVTSHRHGAHYPHEVLTRDAEHPIMRGWGAGWANPAGELYWIEKLWPTAHGLASAKNQEQGNEEICVWTNEYGPKKTRVFGSTLGHHNVTVEHPKFLDLVTRGTLWACGKLEDEYLKPQLPQRVPVNIAQGATATASSEETGKSNFAPRAIDGDASTRWCAANGSFPQSLQLDLGRPRNVTGLGFKWESSTAIYKYRLEGSMDGKTWNVLADRAKADKHYDAETFDVQSLQFLKLTVLGSNTGSWASLWETEVFGTETIEVSPTNSQRAAEAAFLSDVKIPDGFAATLFAAPPALQYPVFVAAAPDGTVYVSVDKNGSLDRNPRRGSVVRLRDVDGDGRAEESKLFVADVDSPRGLVWDRDRLYLMHPPHLSAFIDHNGDGIADEQQVLVKDIAFGFADRPADHTSNGVTLGIDGWLYLAIGDFGFLEATGTDGRKVQFRGGGVVRVRPDGTSLEIYSRGTRNILEVAMDPLLNGFTRDNTNDGDGWDIRLHHFSGGEHHGYPSLFKHFPEEIVQPLADYGGGSGCGALYVSEPGFPDGYGNALYTADWGRNWVYRHTVTPKGATFTPDQHEFIGSTRVTDLDVDASSRLYVTSWKGATFTYAGEDVGYLVRLKPSGYQAPALPDYATLEAAGLVAELRSPSHRRRLAAQRELLGRKLVESAAKDLLALTADRAAALPHRVAALYTLALGSETARGPALQAAIADPQLAPFAARIWGETPDAAKDLAAADSAALVSSADARTTLEALAALGRRQAVEQAGIVATRLADSDPVLAQTALQSFVRIQNTSAATALIDGNSDPALRERALVAMRHWHDPEVVATLIDRLQREPQADRRRGLLTALCRLHAREGTWKGNSWGTRPDTSGPYFQPETWEQSARIAEVLRTTLSGAQAEEASFLLNELSRHKIVLDGALDRLLAMAANDASLVPAAVSELSRTSTIPEGAVPLLLSVTASTTETLDQRQAAALALLRSRDSRAFPAVLAVLPHLADGGKRKLDPVWNAFLKGEVLSPHAELLRAVALKSDDRAALYADAGLWGLVSSKSNAAPEAKALATAAIDEGWGQPARRRRQLTALKISNQREFAERVQASLGDADADVAKLARDIAQDWKLELSPTPRGPQLKTMSPEAAIAAVLRIPGKVGQGEALFAKLNCAKCHTVKAGEPLRGPFLPNVAKTYKRPQLAEAVVLPSKSLAQGFVTYTFVMDDGKTLTGFVTNEAAEEITIRDNEGREFRLATKAIEERAKQAVSVMPEGLAKELTVEEFAALLAYLESLATP